jgi:lipopolysaccharide export system ATP-binding protein
MSLVLTARDLCKSYGHRDVVCGVDIEIGPGEIVGLLGPSGSGKSSIFKILTGVERPDSGVVEIDGRDISRLGIDSRARLGIGYVPQSPELFPSLSMQDNLRIAVQARHRDHRKGDHLLETVLRWFEIEPLRNNRLGTLSGGQRKLVEIAYALCALPQFLLLDEPFAGLDPIVVEKVVARIRAVAKAGLGVLVTDHKARTALSLVSRAVVLDNGMIIASGLPTDVVRQERVRTVFLGENYALESIG